MTMQSPYLIHGPALISFSGGRTSAYLLRNILDAHGGQLPDDVHVVFFNTGKEREETLRFVHECGTRWDVRIRWLEFDPDEPFNTTEVGYNSASRNGEPFAKVIGWKQFLPNPVKRLCTEQLKIKRGISFMHNLLGYGRWENIIALRADEPRRVARQKARNEAGKERFETIMPLDEAGVASRDVAVFWRASDFDLGLPMTPHGTTPMGNCDLCFMKRRSTLQGIMRLDPNAADWWIEQEVKAPALGKMDKPEMALFRADRPSYAAMLKQVQDQGDFEDDYEDDLPCECTD